MLINLTQAANLVHVKSDTIYRYTYPYFTDKREATLTKTEVTGQYMVDTIDLKNVFPKYKQEIESYENTNTITLRSLLEQKMKEAVTNGNYDRACTLLNALEAI